MPIVSYLGHAIVVVVDVALVVVVLIVELGGVRSMTSVSPFDFVDVDGCSEEIVGWNL